MAEGRTRVRIADPGDVSRNQMDICLSSSPRRGSMDITQMKAASLDFRLRGNDEQKQDACSRR